MGLLLLLINARFRLLHTLVVQIPRFAFMRQQSARMWAFIRPATRENLPMNLNENLLAIAKQCAKRLAETSSKVIFAESCTSGLLAATMSRIPGISQHMCGSFVTYRESLKMDAIGVSASTLQQFTAVSAEASREMLAGALLRCSESTIGLAITGHLGPNAPEDLDGIAYVACQQKGSDETRRELRVELESSSRYERQLEAAIAAMAELHQLTHCE